MPPIVLHVPENIRAMQPIIGASKQRLRWKSRSSVFCLVEARILPDGFGGAVFTCRFHATGAINRTMAAGVRPLALGEQHTL